MRFRDLFLAVSTMLGVLSAACQEDAATAPNDAPESAGNNNGANGATTPRPPPKSTDNSCLGKAKLAFDNANCSKCMSDHADCCAATIACFNGDADCAALHSCMAACGGGAAPAAMNGDALQLFATVYQSLSATCSGCHQRGENGAPIFFGADSPATYALFKQQGFQTASSRLLTKGAHLGPALRDDQRAALTAWIGAEAAPPAPATGPGTGTGTGGGTGTGTGTGGGDATGAAVACKNACAAQHPNAVAKWQAYNTCTVGTCRDVCM